MESYSPALGCEGEIVSLAPSVSYSLNKDKIKYQIIEDYYDEKMLRTSEEEYFFEQLKWFELFDKFIKDNISFCMEYSVPLAKANYLRIKYFIDTVVISSFVLSQFFQNNSDLKEITYVHRLFDEDENYSIFEFKSKSRKAFSDLLQLFCGKYNVQFASCVVGKKDVAFEGNLLNSFRRNDFIKSSIKRILNLYKYGKLEKLFTSDTSLKDLNIFFMHAGSLDIDYPIIEAIRHKAHVYVKENGKVIREDKFLRKPVDLPELDEYFLKSLKEESKTCADNLDENAEIISWIDSKCSMNVSSIVLPFLRYFISKDCFYILQESERMQKFYKHNNVDYVFARGNTDRDSLGPLVAAKYMKGPKSICVQHACFALDIEVFGVFETETYNCTVARDNISQDYFEHSIRNRYQTDCKVVQSSHYLRSVRKKYSNKKNVGRRERVVYVEKKFSDKVRCFNNMIYPLTWYYEFQKKLIDCFARESKYEFIYKHAQGQEWAEDSILRYIKDKGCGNIDVSKRHFLKTLESADRVIMDYPSGSLFEAAVFGKPVLCLCADYIRILKQAKNIFGKSIQQFSSIEESKRIIKEFLYGNPKDYIVNIPMSDNGFIDTFREIQRRV